MIDSITDEKTKLVLTFIQTLVQEGQLGHDKGVEFQFQIERVGLDPDHSQVSVGKLERKKPL